MTRHSGDRRVSKRADSPARVLFTLPWPPSANHLRMAVRGRLISTQAARDYRERCLVSMLQQGIPKLGLAGSLTLSITAMPPDNRRRDLSNIIKAAEDSIVAHGLIEDDSLIDRLSVERLACHPGGLLVLSVSQLLERPDGSPAAVWDGH